MNQVLWSPALTKAIYWVLYWKGVIAKAKGRQVGTSMLHCQAKKVGLDHKLVVINQPAKQFKVHLTQAYQQYHQLKNNCSSEICGLADWWKHKQWIKDAQKHTSGSKSETGNDSRRQ